MIRLENLTKHYGSFVAVDDISLQVPRGLLYGFLGPNGAGKTTTLRIIAGILRPTNGRVLLGGDDVHQNPLPAKMRLGFIPDRPFVYDKLTGVEFLRFVAALYGQEGDAVERRIAELLEVFELTSWKDELVEAYSHGMRQKLIISSALIHRPQCIVVDEPMVGLDPKAARLLKDIFRQFVGRGGTVLMSTHTLEVAEAMCDRVAIIQRGKIVGEGKPSLWRVLEPKWRTALQRLREERSRGGSGKLFILILVGLAFWVGVFAILYRILKYFRGVEDLGPLLAGKILGIVLLAFVGILVLSNVITALSSFFLAKDLDLLVSAPVDWLRIYLAKLGETLLHSSWMVALMAVPILAAYGVSYRGGLLFIPYAVLTVLPLLVLPAVAGSALTLVLVNIFPARRTRDLLSIVALGAAGGLILLFRLIRPERLASPEGFRNLLDFIAVLRTPTSPYLPSEWVNQAIMGFLRGNLDPMPLALLWSTAAAFVTLGALLHRQLFAPGFTKAQEAAERFVRGSVWRATVGTALGFLPVAKREFVIKDIKLFFRDTTQWSQLILLAVLVLVYLFNIKTLPLHRGEAVGFFYVTLVSFLNLGLAGFVLAAIAARFIFPAVSLEGRHMWLLRSSPLDLRALLWSKYWVGTIPLLVLALLLTGLTNVLLQVRPFMMVMELVTICGLTFAIAALALGFGALYPQFETENAAQIPTSFGGLVFMMATIVLLGIVIFVLWQAVYQYVRSVFLGQPVVVDAWMIVWFAVAAALCAAATAVPLWVGLRRIERFEF